MKDQEYFYTFPEEYIQALIKLNREDLNDGETIKDICEHWNKKPGALCNDLALMQKAISEGWYLLEC